MTVAFAPIRGRFPANITAPIAGRWCHIGRMAGIARDVRGASAPRQALALLDHLVGNEQKIATDRQAERLRGL
jgi:hypothetical protein